MDIDLTGLQRWDLLRRLPLVDRALHKLGSFPCLLTGRDMAHSREATSVSPSGYRRVRNSFPLAGSSPLDGTYRCTRLRYRSITRFLEFT
jgi:hypothetical protein